MPRGQLTEAVQKVAVAKLGRETQRWEFRLMPYVQYCLMNHKHLDRIRINQEEEEVLADWKARGWLKEEPELEVTKEFWDALHEILWVGYGMSKGQSTCESS